MIIAKSLIEKALNEALSTGAEFAEIFAEESYSSRLSVVDSAPKDAIIGRQYGAGVRVHFGTEEIYITTNDLTEKGLVKAARMAAQAKAGQKRKAPAFQIEDPVTTYDEVANKMKMPWDFDRDRKFQFLKNMDRSARKYSSLVTQTQPYLLEKVQKIQIANSAGLHVEDQRTHYRTFMEVFVEEHGQKESYHTNKFSVEDALFYEHISVDDWAHETVDSALTVLKADFAPAGEMPVVIDKGFGGVIFHEACGHGLETTSVSKDASVFCGKLGEKIAHDCVTAIDDGTIAGGWGSLAFDDEGHQTKKTTLIENGVLKSYMVDQLGQKKTGYNLTGSGRRQNYKFAPTSRMRNTFIAPGKDSLESMIQDIDFGIYAKDMGGGSVNPGTGDYNFAIREAYLIKNGQIQGAVKGASLIGQGIKTLGLITKVGSDLQISAGMCGSVSGSIPAAVGQPPILVSKILVGGRAS
jgi:TldD protein